MERKDKIELFLKSIQTLFVVVGGIIALVKFIDYVDAQLAQKQLSVAETYRAYLSAPDYDPEFLQNAAQAFEVFEIADKTVTDEYFSVASDIGQRFRASFHLHTNSLDSSIILARITGEQELINELFCSDSYVIWLALGPAILELRKRLSDETLYEDIENTLVQCGKFSRDEIEAYKLAVTLRLPN